MFEKFNLKELLTDGFSEIMISPKKLYSISYHFIFPIIICFIFLLLNINLDSDIISNIISSISIFSGLLFAVIFIVTENYLKRKSELENNINEEAILYLKRYKKFTVQVSTLILLSVVIATISIVFLLLYLFCLKANMDSILISKKVFNIFTNLDYSKAKSIFLFLLQISSFIFLFNYLMIIIALLKEVYSMIYDEINYNS